MEKTGLPVDKAQEVVGMVVGFIGDKLPDPIASVVKGLFDGDDASGASSGMDVGSMMDQAKGMFGGLLGRDK